ncbi:Deterin [Carabus blaptoides fortunei]
MDNPVDRLEMILEDNRYQSFKKWPYSSKNKCNAQNMAEAGFFWTGNFEEPDSAQCFVCNKQLDGWESNDDPWDEHRKHESTCLFVTIGKTEEFLTLYQLHELFVAMVKNLTKKMFEQEKQELLHRAKLLKADILKPQKKMRVPK